MRPLLKAILVVSICFMVLFATFYVAAKRTKVPLTDGDVWQATRDAMNSAVNESIEKNGLSDSQDWLEQKILLNLQEDFEAEEVKIIRYNAFKPYTAYFFDVKVDDLKTRFYINGIKDPLMAIRLGLDYEIRMCPHKPYLMHGNPDVLSDCLENHYYHFSREGGDIFARLENRSGDPYYAGLEVFVEYEGNVTLDWEVLGEGEEDLEKHLKRKYGIKPDLNLQLDGGE